MSINEIWMRICGFSKREKKIDRERDREVARERMRETERVANIKLSHFFKLWNLSRSFCIFMFFTPYFKFITLKLRNWIFSKGRQKNFLYSFQYVIIKACDFEAVPAIQIGIFFKTWNFFSLPLYSEISCAENFPDKKRIKMP